MTQATAVATARTRMALPGHVLAGLLVVAGAGTVALLLARAEAILAPLWLLGVVAGFTLQRSRFCFASAFRDLFLFGHSRILKGVLLGLGVATVGFSIVMFQEVPFARFGALPAEAHILPLGLSTVFGGVLFGLGMVLAGGCVSGSLYRMAEGYIGSWVATGGVIVGLGLLAHTWNGWWTLLIRHEPRMWLPASLGYGASVALTLIALLAAFLLVLWWESRGGLALPIPPARPEAQGTFREKLAALGRRLFVKGWSPLVGGAVLGVTGLLMYMVHMPWGVTGELGRWSQGLMGALSIGPPPLLGLEDIGGCAARSAEAGLFTHTFAVTVGILPGALAGALFAREFKLRFPRQRRRYVQSFGGGLLMGYGSGLAIGCTIGAFFSAIPSLSLSGWLFGLSLAAGAFLGVQVIRRIP